MARALLSLLLCPPAAAASPCPPCTRTTAQPRLLPAAHMRTYHLLNSFRCIPCAKLIPVHAPCAPPLLPSTHLADHLATLADGLLGAAAVEDHGVVLAAAGQGPSAEPHEERGSLGRWGDPNLAGQDMCREPRTAAAALPVSPSTAAVQAASCSARRAALVAAQRVGHLTDPNTRCTLHHALLEHRMEALAGMSPLSTNHHNKPHPPASCRAAPDGHLLGGAQHGGVHLLKLEAQVLAHHLQQRG